MLDRTTSLLSFIGQALGVPLGAIPLSKCEITKPYLLQKNGITHDGIAILMAVPYVLTEDVMHPQRNVSLYAVSEDYHLYFEELSNSMIPELKSRYPDNRFALFADHSPIAEVSAAAHCGLGLIGDNGLLITPDFGSFVFLAEIITDLTWFDVTGSTEPFIPQKGMKCQSCGMCIKACPGKCLPDKRNTCVSAISQKKGELSQDEEVLLCSQKLVWGCDTCQLVCPHNLEVIQKKIDTPLEFFKKNRMRHVTEDEILNMSDEQFKRRAYSWRGRSVIIRNIKLKEKEEGL